MRLIILALLPSALLFGASAADAHAFLDHANPTVGSTMQRAPTSVSISFTQELEPAFVMLTVVDQAGNRVDTGNASVDASDATLLHVTLKPLSPGTYKVRWRVLSVDTHTTEGTFSFTVTGG
jgi:copper resistance protein C